MKQLVWGMNNEMQNMFLICHEPEELAYEAVESFKHQPPSL